MKKILIIIFCIFFINAQNIFAQESKEELKLSLDTAISMAIEASEDLKLQDNELKRKKSQKKQETASILPQIVGQAGWLNNFEYPNIASTAQTRDYNVDAGVLLTQTLFTFGKISNAISAAKKAIEASRFNQEGTKQQIIYNAKIAFYNTYLAKRILEIAEESYNNALENKKILEDRAAGGRASKYDNIKISADIASRKPTVNNAQADFLSAMETLKVLIGVKSEVLVKLTENYQGQYPDFDRKDLEQALYNNQPTIKFLKKNIEEKEDLVKSKKATLLPELSAFASWNHKGDSNDYYVGEDNLNDYGIAGLKVSVPIWMGGMDQEKLYQAKIDKNDAELKYKQGQENYLLMLDKAIHQYQEYKKTLEANEDALRLALESFKLSQEFFASGQISVTDLNDAELQLTSAKIRKEITIFNLNSTLSLIEQLTLMEKKNE